MAEIDRTIFSGMQTLIEQKWVQDKAIVVEDEKIKAIIPVDMIAHHLPAKHHQFSNDHYLIPGLIDLHIHGANGKDVMDATPDALKTISHALAGEGVTGFLATTMLTDNQKIEDVLKLMPTAMQEVEGAAILGMHLEGPFIAATKMGAQHGNTQEPDADLIRHWQSLAKGAIKIVTLAPELSGAIDFIHTLRNMDIIASIGHTDATFAETNAAIDAGCSQATHLFNAMRGFHQREPGAAAAVLLSNLVSAELIADGLHLHPAMIEIVLRLMGKDRLLLVTDAMRAKCLGNGEYELGGQQVNVNAGKVTLADGTLAGSTLRLPQAIKNMVKFTDCSLEDAIAMAAYNPARVLRLDDSKGTITVGKDADLVVMNAHFDVMLTMREGKVVFRK